MFFYCIGKIDFLLYISALITIFPYTTRLGYLGLSEQSEDMYYAVTPETASAKYLSYKSKTPICPRKIKMHHAKSYTFRLLDESLSRTPDSAKFIINNFLLRKIKKYLPKARCWCRMKRNLMKREDTK